VKPLVLIAPLLLVGLVVGCGTQPPADSNGDGPGGTIAPGLSTVRVTILWPSPETGARELPSNTARVDVIAAGHTDIGPGGFLVRKSVTAADVVNGTVTVRFQLPAGPAQVVSAEAYDENSALLAVGSATIEYAANQTGTARLVTYLSGGAQTTEPTPGDVIAYRRATSQSLGAPTSIYAIAPDGTGERQVSPSGSDSHYPALSPGATRMIYATSGTDIFQISLAGPPAYSVTAISPGVTGGDLAWSRSGDKIAFVSGGDIYVARPDGALASNVTMTAGAIERHPSFSPDGERICFHLAAGAEDYGDLGTVDVDGTHYTVLTTNELIASTDWSPDEASIAFHKIENAVNGDTEIYIAPIDAGVLGAERKLSFIDAANWASSSPRWSPDGTQLVFVRTSNPTAGETDLWVVEPDDLTTLEQLTDTPDMPEAMPDWR